MGQLNSQDYIAFVREVKQRIRDRQLRAMRSVNRELVELYWDIGKLIHHKQQRLGWGKSVVATLADAYREELPSPEAIATRLKNFRL